MPEAHPSRSAGARGTPANATGSPTTPAAHRAGAPGPRATRRCVARPRPRMRLGSHHAGDRGAASRSPGGRRRHVERDAREGGRAPSRIEWTEDDIAHREPEQAPGLIYSNAALHWVDDHVTLVPRLFRLSLTQEAENDSPRTAIPSSAVQRRRALPLGEVLGVLVPFLHLELDVGGRERLTEGRLERLVLVERTDRVQEVER